MTSDLEDFLATVRDAEDPSAQDEERVGSALRASLAAGAVSSVGLNVTLKSLAGKSVWGSGASTLGTKLGVLAVGGALVASGGHALLARSASLDAMPLRLERSRRPPEAMPEKPPVDGNRRRREAADETSRPKAYAPPVARPEAEPPRLAPKGKALAKPEPRSLQGELELLREVQSALRRGAGQEALSKLDAHRTSDRQFAAERSAARILALCAVGRVQEARRQAEAFLNGHPRSVQRAAILESCAGPPRAAKP